MTTDEDRGSPTRRRMIRLPVAMDQRLEDLARQRFSTVSALIREAVRVWPPFLRADDTELHNHVPNGDT